VDRRALACSKGTPHTLTVQSCSGEFHVVPPWLNGIALSGVYLDQINYMLVRSSPFRKLL
jgi:hypothetical protein